MILALAASLVLAAPPAQPTQKPASLIAKRTPDGGWSLTVPGKPEQATLRVAHAPMTGRTLMAWAAQSEDASQVLGSEAVIVGPDGKTIRAIPLPGLLPIECALSPDGTIAAIVVASHADPNADYQLLVFDDKGTKRAKKKVDPETTPSLLVTRSWIGLSSPVFLPGSGEEEEDAPPPAQTAAPASFLSLEGAPLRPGEPIGGMLATLGADGLVSVASGRVTTHKPTFGRRGRLELGFPVGVPFVSADGTTIAVGDFTDEEKDSRALVILDADAKKVGSATVMASLGVDAALAFDGASVLATSATTGIGGPVIGLDPRTTVELVMLDRTGKQKWKYGFTRRSRAEHVRHLTVSAGGARSAFLRVTADEEDERPSASSLVVLGADGAVVLETDLEAEGLWLDKTGTSLSVFGPASFSRRAVKSLATP